MHELARRLTDVRNQIRDAETKGHRAAGSVTLLAVSKQQSAATIESAFAFGQTNFGENYLQEAVQKIDVLQHLSINWHFIGQIQTNKTRILAEKFDWVHSVDQLKIAQRLSDQRPEKLEPLSICLQVNLDQEPDKGGASVDEAPGLAHTISELRNIRLRGLMAIPMRRSDSAAQLTSFQRMRSLFDELNRQGLPLDTLSMGMTGDLQAAIAAGSTMVRIGTAIFGERSKKQ